MAYDDLMWFTISHSNLDAHFCIISNWVYFCISAISINVKLNANPKIDSQLQIQLFPFEIFYGFFFFFVLSGFSFWFYFLFGSSLTASLSFNSRYAFVCENCFRCWPCFSRIVLYCILLYEIFVMRNRCRCVSNINLTIWLHSQFKMLQNVMQRASRFVIHINYVKSIVEP